MFSREIFHGMLGSNRTNLTYNKMVQDSTVETQLIMWCSILLLRLHVSTPALGHPQVLNCASEETNTLCSLLWGTIRDLMMAQCRDRNM